MLITFEGIECCGKGEQIRRLTKYFEEKGIPYFVNQEPGGRAHGLISRMRLKNPTLVAQALNEAFKHLPKDYPQIPLIDGKIEPALPEQEILDFVHSRVGNTILGIVPALKEGKLIISDRHLHSTKAYQGYGKYHGDKKILDLIDTLHELMIFPHAQIDKTFFIDITYEEQERRRALIEGRDPNDAFETQKKEFYERVINGYRTMAQEDSRIVRIDGMKSPDEVFSDIVKEIEKI